MLNKVLYIVIEVSSREYSSRLILAIEAANRGYDVIIGYKYPIIQIALTSSQRGFFYHKSPPLKSEKFLEVLKKRGFIISAQYEEGGFIYRDYEKFYNENVVLKNIKNLDLYFCWGKEEYDFLKFISNENSQIVKCTGSPRTTLWGADYGEKYFKQEIDLVVKKYGKYVLFASNFGSANNVLPEEEYINFIKSIDEEIWKNDIAPVHKFISRRQNTYFDLFVAAAKQIAEEGEFKVIIRPHPSESVVRWEEAIDNCQNIFVEFGDDIGPWIFGSQFLIHNGCTTGIESVYSEKISFALGYESEDLYNTYESIPNDLSIPVFGLEDLKEKISKRDDIWEEIKANHDSILAEKLYFPGTRVPSKLIIDEFDKMNPINESKILRRNYALYLRKFLSNFKYNYLSTQKSQDQILEKKKRPYIENAVIQKDIKELMKVLGINGEISVKQLAPNAYSLRKQIK